MCEMLGVEVEALNIEFNINNINILVYMHNCNNDIRVIDLSEQAMLSPISIALYGIDSIMLMIETYDSSYTGEVYGDEIYKTNSIEDALNFIEKEYSIIWEIAERQQMLI